MTLEAAESVLGFERGGRGPAQDHVAPTPPLHTPRDTAHALVEALGWIRGAQALLERAAKPEPLDRQRLLQPLAETVRSAAVGLGEDTDQVLELAKDNIRGMV